MAEGWGGGALLLFEKEKGVADRMKSSGGVGILVHGRSAESAMFSDDEGHFLAPFERSSNLPVSISLLVSEAPAFWPKLDRWAATGSDRVGEPKFTRRSPLVLYHTVGHGGACGLNEVYCHNNSTFPIYHAIWKRGNSSNTVLSSHSIAQHRAASRSINHHCCTLTWKQQLGESCWKRT